MAKKSFSEITNPALQFMTQPEGTTDEPLKDMSESNVSFNGLKRGRPISKEETKSKRVNLLMLPSVYEDTVKIAAMKRMSVNELVNSLLQANIEDSKELLEKYNEVFGE